MSELWRCELCGRDGHEGHDIVQRPVEWTDAAIESGRAVARFETILRCAPDHQACRARVEAAGKPWPIHDACTVPTVEPPPPDVEQVPL